MRPPSLRLRENDVHVANFLNEPLSFGRAIALQGTFMDFPQTIMNRSCNSFKTLRDPTIADPNSHLIGLATWQLADYSINLAWNLTLSTWNSHENWVSIAFSEKQKDLKAIYEGMRQSRMKSMASLIAQAIVEVAIYDGMIKRNEMTAFASLYGVNAAVEVTRGKTANDFRFQVTLYSENGKGTFQMGNYVMKRTFKFGGLGLLMVTYFIAVYLFFQRQDKQVLALTSSDSLPSDLGESNVGGMEDKKEREFKARNEARNKELLEMDEIGVKDARPAKRDKRKIRNCMRFDTKPAWINK
jgi:hypothetical protein